MNNRRFLIVGQPGSGKTTLARYIMARTPRALIFDPKHEWEPAKDGMVTWNMESAVRYMLERREEDWQLVFRATQDPASEAGLLLTFVERLQREPNMPPLALLLEEASMYGSTMQLEDQVHRIYNLGRAWRINILAVIQVDTDAHRVMRHHADAIITLRQIKLTTDLQRMFDSEQTVRLEGLKPGMTPEYGKHFLTYPPDYDVMSEWDSVNTLQ